MPGLKLHPMLATAYQPKYVEQCWRDWVLEEKLDGHRVFIRVGKRVTAYKRPRRGQMPVAELPDHLRTHLSWLRPGLYDGELLAGDTATDVKRKDLQHEARVVLFDVLERNGTLLIGQSLAARRQYLEEAYTRSWTPVVRLIDQATVRTEADMKALATRIIKRGGEGLMLKHRVSTYEPGERTRTWLKYKRFKTAALRVVGFEESRGEKVNRGRYAVVLLRDARGKTTSVKTLDNEQLRRFEERARSVSGHAQHPDIGRMLRIEFPRWTRDGGYQGPVMWDRWEDE